MPLGAIDYATKCDNNLGKAQTVAETKQTTEERQMSQRKAKRHKPPKDDPLKTPTLCAEIIRLLREGCTASEVCDRDDMPARATLFDWLKADHLFRADYEEAKTAAAEMIVNDALDYAREHAVDGDGEPDLARTRVAEMYAKVANGYAAAIAPRQFGQLIKLGAEGEAGGLQVIITSYGQGNPPRTGGEACTEAPSDGTKG